VRVEQHEQAGRPDHREVARRARRDARRADQPRRRPRQPHHCRPARRVVRGDHAGLDQRRRAARQRHVPRRHAVLMMVQRRVRRLRPCPRPTLAGHGHALLGAPPRGMLVRMWLPAPLAMLMVQPTLPPLDALAVVARQGRGVVVFMLVVHLSSNVPRVA